MTVRCNEKATFECELSVVGLTVTWLKDGQKLTIDHDRLYTDSDGSTHQLIIYQLNSDDAGQYTAVCQQHSTTASLSVLSESHIYLLQGGYIFVVVCLYVCVSLCKTQGRRLYIFKVFIEYFLNLGSACISMFFRRSDL